MVYQYRHRYCYTTIHTAIMLACIPLFTLAAGLQEEGKVPTSAIFLWGVPFNFGVPCRQIPRLARRGLQGHMGGHMLASREEQNGSQPGPGARPPGGVPGRAGLLPEYQDPKDGDCPIGLPCSPNPTKKRGTYICQKHQIENRTYWQRRQGEKAAALAAVAAGGSSAAATAAAGAAEAPAEVMGAGAAPMEVEAAPSEVSSEAGSGRDDTATPMEISLTRPRGAFMGRVGGAAMTAATIISSPVRLAGHDLFPSARCWHFHLFPGALRHRDRQWRRGCGPGSPRVSGQGCGCCLRGGWDRAAAGSARSRPGTPPFAPTSSWLRPEEAQGPGVSLAG